MSQDEVKTVFEYNGHSYEFDVRDAEYAERFNDALQQLDADEKAVPKDGLLHVHITAHCDMLKRFFDTCLGEGAGEEICTKRSNLRTCYDAYEAFLLLVSGQKDDVIAAKNTFAKYSNRQQRRTSNQQKNHPKK